MVDRLGDEDAGAGAAGVVVDDDHALDVERLRQEHLPQRTQVGIPATERFQVGCRFAVDEVDRPVDDPAQVATVAADDVVEGRENAAVRTDAGDLELLSGEVLGEAEPDQAPSGPVVVPDRVVQHVVESHTEPR